MAHHTGSCHCGAVAFSVEAEFTKGMVCNCSICRKRGSVLDFVPEAAMTLQQGADKLTDYRFNQHRITHQFCSVCGILPFARAAGPDGTPMVAINLRCVDGLDLKNIQIAEYDGAST